MKAALILAVLLAIAQATGAQEESYGLSFLAEQLNKYCQISTPRNAECERPSVQPLPTANSRIRVGKAGPRGPRGPPGIVDYDAINDKIEAKLTGYVGVLEKMREMEQFMHNVKLGRCQVIYNEKCFWFIYSQINYAEGRELCLQAGATPANVYSEDHYRKLRKYVRGHLRVVTQPWLGMTYNSQTRTTTLYNGTTLQIAIPWYPGYPSANAGWTQMALSARQDASHSDQGIWNYKPSRVKDGIICEI